MNVEELFKYMLEFFNNTEKNLQNEREKLGEKDMEISDVLHYLEIHTLKSYDLAKIGKLLQELRRERREIKYNIEVMELFQKFSEKYNNKFITKDIMQTLKDLGKKDKTQENPIYKYRTDILEKIGVKIEMEEEK